MCGESEESSSESNVKAIIQVELVHKDNQVEEDNKEGGYEIGERIML